MCAGMMVKYKTKIKMYKNASHKFKIGKIKDEKRWKINNHKLNWDCTFELNQTKHTQTYKFQSMKNEKVLLKQKFSLNIVRENEKFDVWKV